MLRNNTRIIAFNPRFSNLVTRECLEKLAGTRKSSSNANHDQDQAKGSTSSNVNNTLSTITSIYRPVPDYDFFGQTRARTRNSSRLAAGARGGRRPDLSRHGLPPRLMPSSSESMANSSSTQFGGYAQQQQQPEHPVRRMSRHKRSQSFREHRSRQLLSVLHEEETFPLSPPTSSSWHPSTSTGQGYTCTTDSESDVTSSHPRTDPPDNPLTSEDSIDNTLVRTRNAKGSSFRRFVNQGSTSTSNGSSCTSSVSSSIPNKRQCFLKRRSRRFRLRVIATLVVIRAQYQSLVSSLKGVETHREYATFDAMSVNPMYDSPFVDDVDSPVRHENNLLQFDHEHPADLTDFRTFKVRFRRSISCKI